jgi:hypothetical protein
MCTSFVDRRDDLIIAMNFDNNGMVFELNTKNANIFSIDVNTKTGKTPSFGINNKGIFVNNLCVDSNGNGVYKRVTKTRTLNVYLVKDLLEGKILENGFDDYFKTMEIVNAPNLSTHNLVVDKKGNVFVIEPGRGYIKNGAKETQYFVMTNFSLIDFNGGKKYTDYGIDRYNEVNNILNKSKKININEAFKILEKVKQEGEWNTDFSMVYSQKNKTVYYCYKSNFKEILEYRF